LLFHSVVDANTVVASSKIDPDTSIASDVFEEIISRLSGLYVPLSLDEVLGGAKNHGTGFVITFDDGFRDNLFVALPILKKYNVPATIYITSGFIDRSVFPFEYRLAAIVRQEQEICLDTDNYPKKFLARTPEEKLKTYLHIKNKLKYTSNDFRYHTLNKLAQKCKFSKSSIQFLSIPELTELSNSSLITIGSHSHYHQVLTSISTTEARKEVRLGKSKIEEWVGKPSHHFSYPYGVYNKNVTKIIAEAGFKSAVTTKAGIERYGFNDPQSIFRFEVKNLVDLDSITTLLNK